MNTRELRQIMMGCGKLISTYLNFDGRHIWNKRRSLEQDAQKVRPAKMHQSMQAAQNAPLARPQG
jgi:hypothetical protein